jgi:hypothetical protein
VVVVVRAMQAGLGPVGVMTLTSFMPDGQLVIVPFSHKRFLP